MTNSASRPAATGPCRSRRGVTLIEMAIVLAIISVMTAIGIAMSTDLKPRWDTRAAAKTFASHVNQCRMLAVQTGRECKIWLVDYDSDLSNTGSNTGEWWIGLGNKSKNSTTWDYLPVDDLDGTSGTDSDQSEGMIDLGDSTKEHYHRHVALDNWGTINGYGSGNSDSIIFDTRGHMLNPTGDLSSGGYIRITFVNKLANSKNRTEEWYVDIYPTGSASIESSSKDGTTSSGSGAS